MSDEKRGRITMKNISVDGAEIGISLPHDLQADFDLQGYRATRTKRPFEVRDPLLDKVEAAIDRMPDEKRSFWRNQVTQALNGTVAGLTVQYIAYQLGIM